MSVSQTLDELYFDFLCQKVGMKGTLPPSQSYFLLLEQLYRLEFLDWLPNDQNRTGDGLELREQFLNRRRLEASADWVEMPCSIFEMLVALATRVAYHTDWPPSASFWMLIRNLELDRYHDENYHDGIHDGIEHVIHQLNNRTYEANGRGGLFPLRNPREDQRDVEIWYQMHAFLGEHIEL